jgi:hypothetical protein
MPGPPPTRKRVSDRSHGRCHGGQEAGAAPVHSEPRSRQARHRIAEPRRRGSAGYGRPAPLPPVGGTRRQQVADRARRITARYASVARRARHCRGGRVAARRQHAHAPGHEDRTRSAASDTPNWPPDGGSSQQHSRRAATLATRRGRSGWLRQQFIASPEAGHGGKRRSRAAAPARRLIPRACPPQAARAASGWRPRVRHPRGAGQWPVAPPLSRRSRARWRAAAAFLRSVSRFVRAAWRTRRRAVSSMISNSFCTQGFKKGVGYDAGRAGATGAAGVTCTCAPRLIRSSLDERDVRLRTTVEANGRDVSRISWPSYYLRRTPRESGHHGPYGPLRESA